MRGRVQTSSGGLNGGGGDFSIATSFEHRVQPVGPMVLAGMLFYPMDEAREVLAFLRDLIVEVPDELGVITNLMEMQRRRGPCRSKGLHTGDGCYWCDLLTMP